MYCIEITRNKSIINENRNIAISENANDFEYVCVEIPGR